mmetsp:Transcript_97418/g.225842  ORF Transcript_97418/g.225842 Transcript_97418/m.225842 type:complete len:253 (+) Transcript_97418:438-1196(+)
MASCTLSSSCVRCFCRFAVLWSASCTRLKNSSWYSFPRPSTDLWMIVSSARLDVGWHLTWLRQTGQQNCLWVSHSATHSLQKLWPHPRELACTIQSWQMEQTSSACSSFTSRLVFLCRFATGSTGSGSSLAAFSAGAALLASGAWPVGAGSAMTASAVAGSSSAASNKYSKIGWSGKCRPKQIRSPVWRKQGALSDSSLTRTPLTDFSSLSTHLPSTCTRRAWTRLIICGTSGLSSTTLHCLGLRPNFTSGS